jgi:hypothetical protein
MCKKYSNLKIICNYFFDNIPINDDKTKCVLLENELNELFPILKYISRDAIVENWGPEVLKFFKKIS